MAPSSDSARESVGRAYAGQTADERDAQRRARLLAATRELIGTVGYAATTIERICSLASVSTRHFYRQYDGKESAFLDLYDELTKEAFQHVLEALSVSEGQPLRERVKRGFLAYLQPMFADVRTARIAFVEVIGVSPRIEQVRLEYREMLIALVQSEGSAGVARGEVADRDFRFAALSLIGAANVVVHDWAIHHEDSPAADVQSKLVDLAVTLLAG